MSLSQMTDEPWRFQESADSSFIGMSDVGVVVAAVGARARARAHRAHRAHRHHGDGDGDGGGGGGIRQDAATSGL